MVDVEIHEELENAQAFVFEESRHLLQLPFVHRGRLSLPFRDFCLEIDREVCVVDALVIGAASTSPEDVVDMRVWIHDAKLLDNFWEILHIDCAVGVEIIILHNVIQSLSTILHGQSKLLEECLLDLLHHLARAVLDAEIHPRNEFIVRHRPTLVLIAQVHQIVDLVVPEVEVQSSHALSELLGGDGSVAIRIEEGEGPPHVEALQEEGRGDLVQNLVQSALPQVGGLKEAAEFLDVNFSDLLWVGDTPQQSMILNREG